MLTGCGLRPPTRWALIAVSLPIIAIHFAAIIHRRALHPGDFDLSREFGRRFLHGEYLYRGGLHFPYLPSAAMYFSPLAMVPAPIAFVVSYCLAIACLPLIFMMLHAMIRGQSPMLESRGFLIAAAALLLGIHYVIRDLDEYNLARDHSRWNLLDMESARVSWRGLVGTRRRHQGYSRRLHPVFSIEAEVAGGNLYRGSSSLLDHAADASHGTVRLVESSARMDDKRGRIRSRPQPGGRLLLWIGTYPESVPPRGGRALARKDFRFGADGSIG
jgi:hypothetical protein